MGKKKKEIMKFAVASVLVLIMAVFPIAVYAGEKEQEEESTTELELKEEWCTEYYSEEKSVDLSSEGIQYRLLASGADYEICGYVGNDVEIIIPEMICGKKVVSIGNGAFRSCGSLVSITIPNGVTSIGEDAFFACNNLSMVIIPESVTSIGQRAFWGCQSLTSVIIPESASISSIEPYTFYFCSSLKSIIIPESVTHIGAYAFWGCDNLTNVTIPKNVIQFGEPTLPLYKDGKLKKIVNDSAVIIDLKSAYGEWYDSTTGQMIEHLGKGIAAYKEPMTLIDILSITPNNGTVFVYDNGNDIDIKDVIIVKEHIILPEKSIVGAVEDNIENMVGIPEVSYYDISAHVNEIGGKQAILNGNITMKLEYPVGVTKDCDIIVLQNTNRLRDEDVKKYDGYFTLKTDSLGLFAVISLETKKISDDPVHAFVNRLYTLVLAREADEIGLESWTDALIKKKSNGVDIGYGFVFSDECKEKNLSNEEFVEILYNTFMNRSSDAGGKASWVSQLDAGVEREKVFAGFIYSVEFADICSEYKIKVGNVFEVGRLADALAHYRNQNADITKFVARCYTEALGREYEPDGLEAWCKVIIEKSNTPKQAAQSFIFSDEFLEKNLNNEEYVKVLYRTFMGREADEIGLAGWVEVLESGREDRMKVMEGFSDSAEFAEILASFGLN